MKFLYVLSLFAFFTITGCEAKRESGVQGIKSAINIQEFKEIVESSDEIKQKNYSKKYRSMLRIKTLTLKIY
nr:hypothetical protein [Acinetobacter bereziniae]